MVLQPLKSPGGVNLFRHPNGQIIQLVPLQQFRAAGAQPNVQPMMLRNPGTKSSDFYLTEQCVTQKLTMH